MITIDTRWLKTSGIGTYLQNIVPGIIAAFPKQIFCLIGKLDEMEQYGLLSGDNVRPVPSAAPMYSLREQVEIASKIPKATQLYFATHYNIPLLYRGRMLVTVYDLFHLAMPGLVGGLRKSAYARFMFNAVRRKADAIITISKFTRDELVRYTGPGRQEIYPIHLGVDKSWFDIRKTQNPHQRPFLLYVGNVKPHKNLQALVRAFALIADETDHDLLIVGKKEGFITGDEAPSKEAAKLEGRVHFTGHVSEELLKQYVAHAEALVFPSLYEGFGLPALEAMAAGCPVIASSVASLPEVCGDAVLYCDPYQPRDIASRILELLDDDAGRRELKLKGNARARQFTWETCIHETCSIIEGLLSELRTRP
jgi:glycosyltransferase involved in cell wall biosynthesis